MLRFLRRLIVTVILKIKCGVSIRIYNIRK